MVVGTIAVVCNLPSLAAAERLRFDAALLADIFAGRITRWSDARISAHNGGGALPDIAVTVVHRGSGSGTGQAFAAFLSTSDRWPRIDDTTDVRWPVGTPVEGNEGMAVEVKVTAGAIGYVERRMRDRTVLPWERCADHLDSSRRASARRATRFPLAPGSSSIRRAHLRRAAVRLWRLYKWALRGGAQQARLLEYTPIAADTVAHYNSLQRAIPFESCGAALKLP